MGQAVLCCQQTDSCAKSAVGELLYGCMVLVMELACVTGESGCCEARVPSGLVIEVVQVGFMADKPNFLC